MPFVNVTISKPPDAQLAQAVSDAVTDASFRILGKPREITSVAVSFVAPEHWIVGGRSLASQGLASFWLDIKVTDSTNTKTEKAEFLREIFASMGRLLGPLHEESYVLVHDVRADAYGYGGKTQEFRFVRALLEPTPPR
jgi:4-oxalocrotonate tautomerase